MWRQYGFFDARKSDYGMEKVNFPESTILYLNQAYLTVKKSKKKYYCDFFILSQIVEASNRPEDMSTYILKENEVKMVRTKYNSETGIFLGLYETVVFVVVKGSPEEVSFNYGYHKDKSKVLYSHLRRRIPKSFSGTIFNRHRAMIETGENDSEFSGIYFFLPSITDRSEDINKYLKNVSISPNDITQKQFNDWAGCEFNPAKLDLFGADKTIMSAAVTQCVRHINDISNSNLVRNADTFLSQKEIEVPVGWIRDSKKRVTPSHFKVAY